jgi:hypothetical protein
MILYIYIYIYIQGWSNGIATGVSAQGPSQFCGLAENKSLLNNYYKLENITLLIKI